MVWQLSIQHAIFKIRSTRHLTSAIVGIKSRCQVKCGLVEKMMRLVNMFYICSYLFTLLFICSGENITSGSGRGRMEKALSIFTVVKFPNDGKLNCPNKKKYSVLESNCSRTNLYIRSYEVVLPTISVCIPGKDFFILLYLDYKNMKWLLIWNFLIITRTYFSGRFLI